MKKNTCWHGRILRNLVPFVLVPLFVGSTGCSGDDGEEGIPKYSVTGNVVDFVTGEKLDTQASITTSGLSPAPTITVTGTSFLIRDVPLHSVFQVLASAPPTYRSTYNPAIEVTEDNVDDVTITALSESYLDMLKAAFGVSPVSGTSILVGRLIDDKGQPVANVPATAFDLAAGLGPVRFLDDQRQPAPNLTASSASGYFVLYNVPTGLMRITSKDENFGMSMADSPIAATAVTLADVVVGDGQAGTPLPTTVSFTKDVAPIFLRRRCDACHDGGGIGKDLGGLHLNGAPEKMYKELVEEISPRVGTKRVDLQQPAKSLVLTMPSREDPPDSHPNITFASSADPDYQILLRWIEQGAKQN